MVVWNGMASEGIQVSKESAFFEGEREAREIIKLSHSKFQTLPMRVLKQTIRLGPLSVAKGTQSSDLLCRGKKAVAIERFTTDARKHQKGGL